MVKPAIDRWTVPEWHSDFGDAKVEFEHLRSMAIAIVEALSLESIDLVVPEPGLMYVKIALSDGKVAEVYSIEGEKPNKRRYGIFQDVDTDNEQEHYSETVEDVVKVIQRQ